MKRILLLVLHLLVFILPSSLQAVKPEVKGTPEASPGRDEGIAEPEPDYENDDPSGSSSEWEIEEAELEDQFSDSDLMNQTQNEGHQRAMYLQADTNLGRVRGRRGVSRIGKTFYQFKGIPYALPPVGNLRFEPPAPHGGWGGVLDATAFRPQCMQLNVVSGQIMGSENCLYLNVYTERASSIKQNKGAFTKDKLQSVSERDLHPVIVFIHGGLFMFGGSTPFGAKYFLDEEVVLVTLNYRLASFGFLNIGNSLIPGNMGLKDQALALKWIQDNIRYFNGDPNRVTLLGESAGAVAVHLHTLSPMSRGLFSRAISQSGTALSPWGLIENHVEQSREFAEGLGCSTENSYSMVQCLKGLSGRKIASYHRGYIKALAQEKNSLFGPTIESKHNNGKYFMPLSPLIMLKQGRISRTPWITGVNSAEGLVQLIPIMRNKELLSALNNRWDHFAPNFLSIQHHRKKSFLTSKIKEHYLQNSPIGSSNLLDAVAMISDRNFFLDNHDAAILQSRAAPTYVYHYTYEGKFSLGNLLFSKTVLPLPDDINYMTGAGLNWMGMMMGLKRKSKFGICHGDEIPLMFNMLVRGEVNKRDSDFDFSRKLIRLWVSFAESGVPETRQVGYNGPSVRWEPVRRSNRDLQDIPLKYLNIDKHFSTVNEPFHRGLQFWKNNSISYL